MRAPGFYALFLFFVLELTPRPGNSLGFGAHKNCPNCKSFIKPKLKKESNLQWLVKKANYTECHTNIIVFTLPNGTICGDKLDSWVDQVIKGIDQGRTSRPPQSEKPSTTTQELPTSTTKTSPPLRLSTQTWTGGTSAPSKTTIEELTSTQKVLETIIGLKTTTRPDSNPNKKPLLGNEASSTENELKSKMSHMTTAIISLLLIVLVMTAVGVYVWCRKGSFPHFKRHCVEETVRYEPTPSEDSIGP